ncbi:MAG TPA: hypothetical protein VNO75_07050 [Gemmatimonadaceae bacterium]|nr:hypothetical protein [Gemmatimonadaceae bacterium]
MTKETSKASVLSFSRPGTWLVPDGFRDRAHFCLDQVQAHDAETDGDLADLKADPLHRRRILKAAEFPNALEFFSDSAVIAAAMAIEGFLNLYGVVRLGELFYQGNYERLNPAQKVAALLGTCCGVLIHKDDEIVQVARRVFDRRNALVHPKSRDLGRKDRARGAARQLPQQIAYDSAIDMERFATLFATYDPDATDLGGI